jgi:hypothetical protein
MSRRSVGVLGCVLVGLGAVVGAAIAFGERALIAAGVPFHFLGYITAALALLAVGFGLGVRAWPTGPGKAAAVGGVVAGMAIAGFVALVLAAFA